MYRRLFSSRVPSDFSKRLVVGEEVRDALATGRPVVALESTVITHGLPSPHNLSTAALLEDTIRREAAVPATIALLDGQIRVGLSAEELGRIADPGVRATKVSVRDLANVLVKKTVGGTTVAATMRIAHAAGIRVFATGGIGGVHRGVEETFDISADLVELGRTPVAVVCAGAKSILDIPKTLEYLETHSCNVIVFGSDRRFPGFFTPHTPHLAPINMEKLEEIAAVLRTSDELGLDQGTLVACPLPSVFAKAGEQIESVIQEAVVECRNCKIASKDVTPFILARVNELTHGKSMETNIALLENNARIGARLARLYSAQSTDGSTRKSAIRSSPPTQEAQCCDHPHHHHDDCHSGPKPKVVCVGAAIVDFEVITNERVQNDGGSYKGSIFQRCGGVARNHADALGRLGCEATLLTAVGDDDLATYLRSKAKHFNISQAAVARGVPSATYMSVNVDGTVVHGFSSIEASVAAITPTFLESQEELLADSDFVLIDGNVRPDALSTVLRLAERHNKPVWFEPTDIAKATKILADDGIHKIHSISPNANEAARLCQALQFPPTQFRQFEEFLTDLRDTHTVSTFLQSTGEWQCAMSLFQQCPRLTNFFLTLGPIGSVAVHRDPSSGKVGCFPVPPPIRSQNQIVSVSGAGDCFNSGFLAAHLMGRNFEESVLAGLQCAKQSLLEVNAVPDSLTMPHHHHHHHDHHH